MSVKEFALEIVQELDGLTNAQYGGAKASLQSMFVDNAEISRFLEVVFSIVESRRPKLIEMKGGAI